MGGVRTRIREVYRRVAVLPILLLSARWCRYRARRLDAKDRLIRATSIAPGCFKAHLALGALYLEESDFRRAKREFLLARQLNPGKFRRLYPLVTGASGDVNINLFYFPGYTDRAAAPCAGDEDFLKDFIGESVAETPGEGGRYGDFCTYREFRRFQEMGPIREDEVAVLDWRKLERQFAEDASRGE